MSRSSASRSRACLESLRQAPPVVAPSLLLCDFGNLHREVLAVEAAGARCLHLDVMDGVFVPNITYGMTIVSAVRRMTSLPLDVHMMIVQPENYIDAMADAGADILTFHAEAVDDPIPVLHRIRASGMGAGLALNPKTPLGSVRDSIPHCDLVLAMSVEPGFGAQEFEPVALDKLRDLKQSADDNMLLEVDGGVNASTISECAEAGAQMMVVGSAIFRNQNATYQQSILELTNLATTR